MPVRTTPMLGLPMRAALAAVVFWMCASAPSHRLPGLLASTQGQTTTIEEVQL